MLCTCKDRGCCGESTKYALIDMVVVGVWTTRQTVRVNAIESVNATIRRAREAK